MYFINYAILLQVRANQKTLAAVQARVRGLGGIR